MTKDQARASGPWLVTGLLATLVTASALFGCGRSAPSGGFYGGFEFNGSDALPCSGGDGVQGCDKVDGGGGAPRDGGLTDVAASDSGAPGTLDVHTAAVDAGVADAAVDAGKPDVASQPDTKVADPDTAGTADTAAPSADTKKGPTTFGDIYSKVLVKYGCTAPKCHGTKGGAYAYFVDPALAYDLIANKASKVKECQFLPIVLPGNPEASLLYAKVKIGVASCGAKMPSGTTGLPDAAAQIIYDWIKAGAPK